MKRIICKTVYDTETATLIAKHTVGVFGDPTGYEEALYMTEGGKLFVYTNGGKESAYAEENLKRISAAKAEEWKTERGL